MSDEDIAKDYNLTEIGLEPLMPALIARFQKEPRFRDNWEATWKMASAKYVLFDVFVTLLYLLTRAQAGDDPEDAEHHSGEVRKCRGISEDEDEFD